MSAFLGFVNVLSVPLFILNIFGEVVSGLWLLIIGEWRMVLLGIAIMVVSTFALGMAVLPSLLFVPLATFSKGEVGKVVAMILSTLYIAAVMVLWCAGVLWLFGRGLTARNIVPMLIWSYGVAVGPWAGMANKDQKAQGGNTYSLVSVFFAEIGYVVAIIMVLTGTQNFSALVKVLAGFLVAAQIVNWMLYRVLSREEAIANARAVPEEGEEDEAGSI